MLGISEAAHQEISPDTEFPLIHRLECVIAGEVRTVRIEAGTIASEAYGRDDPKEHFRCSFGLNPRHRGCLDYGKLRVSGVDDNGEVRIVELAGHPFFVATLFVPQLSSTASAPHPLIVEFLRVAAGQRRVVTPLP